MCKKESIPDAAALQRRAELSRRDFGALTVGAGFALMAPAFGAAMSVDEADVEFKTADGVADAYFVHPAQGKHPAVLIWPDASGLRPTFKQMGKRLAQAGYSVLIINQYYRSKKAPVFGAGADSESQSPHLTFSMLMEQLSPQRTVSDAKACIGFLERQASVDAKRKMATAGYCMGGAMTMHTAAALPERIGAAAAFHAGGLVNGDPDSPHLLVPKMQAHYLVAIAQNDDEEEPQTKDVLRAAFAKASLPAEIEVYPGAMHGWCPPDTEAYNEPQAERAWARMLALFDRALA